MPLARLIEDLTPTNANDGPNPEYPWQEPSTVIAPASHLFPSLRFTGKSMLNMLKFLDRCFQII